MLAHPSTSAHVEICVCLQVQAPNIPGQLLRFRFCPLVVVHFLFLVTRLLGPFRGDLTYMHTGCMESFEIMP
jgi:hypothetical protein